jgi:hypothetical protein
MAPRALQRRALRLSGQIAAADRPLLRRASEAVVGRGVAERGPALAPEELEVAHGVVQEHRTPRLAVGVG